jgi:glycosyltransferase involved in cell wall biosynthesis
MDKLLSIVIPVYNVEKYIVRCLDSLLVPHEQFKLLDIVIINDGTPDDSAIIAKEYEKKFPEIIRVIDQENRGHGGAWNHGTELDALVGKPYSKELIKAEATRYIQEALLINEYILDVDVLDVSFEADTLTAQVKVTTIYGEVDVVV